jgi:hypothetical protein
MDVVISALALVAFILIEGTRIGLARRWMPIVATCIVGVWLGLPLFLYQASSASRSRRPLAQCREPGTRVRACRAP